MSSQTAKQTATILVVDDDIDFLMQQKLWLQQAGYTVITADTAAEAEQLAITGKFDAAVVDLMMENVDSGFTLCYHIKKHKPAVPIIMVTGVQSETGMEFDAATNEERAWVKADVILTKPVRVEQLTGEIERLLGKG